MTDTATTPTGFPGFAPGEQRHLLADVHRWARTNGWNWHECWGWVNAPYASNATLGIDWDSDNGTITVRAGQVLLRPTTYPVASVRQAVDMLVALDILPPQFSSAFGVEAVIADREAQAASPEVANAVAFTLEMELRPWFGPRSISEEHLRRIAARLVRSAEWVHPAAPGCNCSATGGQGLVPTASREHADDCPAVAR